MTIDEAVPRDNSPEPAAAGAEDALPLTVGHDAIPWELQCAHPQPPQREGKI